jgi:hypothetical protein
LFDLLDIVFEIEIATTKLQEEELDKPNATE